MSEAWSSAGLARMQDVMDRHVRDDEVPGLVWVVARHGEVHGGAVGTLEVDGDDPVGQDTIFRISSLTKPVTAVAALILVEECRVRLDEPVDRWLPELADRGVLMKSDGPLDETVPAARPITLRDLLTFRMGTGMDFTAWGAQPVLDAAAELGLNVGPPAPQRGPEPDEWMRRFGTLPLERQPGERWLYQTSADVLGVLIARVAGQSLEAFMRDKIFDPLGMADTAFSVPTDKMDRFGPCFSADAATGQRVVYDAADGQWSRPPAFPGGGDGLVSTVPDYLAFAEMLLGLGTAKGRRILSRPSVEAMTTNHLTPEQLTTSSPDLTGAVGWGFGCGVQLRRGSPSRSVGTYSWDGGLGSTWANDRAEGVTGILFTNQTWTSPQPPPVCEDFWTCAYAAIDD